MNTAGLVKFFVLGAFVALLAVIALGCGGDTNGTSQPSSLATAGNGGDRSAPTESLAQDKTVAGIGDSPGPMCVGGGTATSPPFVGWLYRLDFGVGLEDVSQLSLSSDGSFVAVGYTSIVGGSGFGIDGLVVLLDADGCVVGKASRERPIHYLTVLPDGSGAALGFSRAIMAEGRQGFRTISYEQDESGSRRLSFISNSGESLWDTTLEGVTGLAVFNDGRHIAVSTFNDVHMVDAANGQIVWTWDGSSSVKSVDITKDGSRLVIGASDGVHVLDSAGNVVWQVAIADLREAVFFNGSEVVVVTSESRILAYGSDGNNIWKRDGSKIAASGINLAIAGGNSLSLVDSRGITIWDINIEGQFRGLAIAETDRTAAFTEEGTLYVFDQDGEILIEHDLLVAALAISDQGSEVVVTSHSGYVQYIRVDDTRSALKATSTVTGTGGELGSYDLGNAIAIAWSPQVSESSGWPVGVQENVGEVALNQVLSEIVRESIGNVASNVFGIVFGFFTAMPTVGDVPAQLELFLTEDGINHIDPTEYSGDLAYLSIVVSPGVSYKADPIIVVIRGPEGTRRNIEIMGPDDGGFNGSYLVIVNEPIRFTIAGDHRISVCFEGTCEDLSVLATRETGTSWIIDLLESIPAEVGTGSPPNAWVNNFAKIRELVNIPIPGPDAGWEERAYYTGGMCCLAERDHMALIGEVKLPEGIRSTSAGEVPWISGIDRNKWRLIEDGTLERRYLGFDERNVDQTIFARSEHGDYEAIRGRFSPKETALALDACSQCPPPDRENYKGMPFYSWDSGVKAARIYAPPAFDQFGRGGRIAVQNTYVFRTLDTGSMKAMIDARNGQIRSLADVEGFELMADAMDELGAFSAALSANTQRMSESRYEFVDMSRSAVESLASATLPYMDSWEEALEKARLSLQDEFATLKLLMQSAPLLRPYQAFTSGVGKDNNGFYTALVLVHENEILARENVGLLNRRLLETASISKGVPWSEIIDTANAEIRAEGRLLLAKLYPSTGQKRVDWALITVRQDSLLIYRSMQSNSPTETPMAVKPAVESGELLWRFKLGSATHSPAVAGGVVFVGSGADDYLYALDAFTGDVLWRYGTGSIVGSPAVAGGVVYVGSRDHYLYALDASTGDLLWRYETGRFVESSPAVAGGIVYVGSNDHYLYALDASTGDLLWRYQTSGRVSGGPAVAGGVVYVGIGPTIELSGDIYVYALDASTGVLLWRYRTDYAESTPAVAGGVVYIGSHDTYVYALDAFTGDLLWRYETGSIVGSPAVAGGVVYVGSEEVYALDASTGDLLWRYYPGTFHISSPAIAGGVVYVGTGNKYEGSGHAYLYALDASTGDLLWRYETGGSLASSPAVAAGVVYIGSFDEDYLYAIGGAP